MDFATSLVRAILDGGRPAYRDFLDRDIPEKLLVGEGKKALEVLTKHFQDYGDMPSVEVMEGKYGFSLPPNPPGTNAAFWADEILTNGMAIDMRDTVSKMVEMFKTQDIHKAFEEMQASTQRCTRLQLGGADSRVTSLFDEGPKVREYYNKIKAGERGILTPWPTINESSLGFNPEELILFAARSGIGKTWASLMIAQTAWAGLYPGQPHNKRYKVLYVTTEMSKLRIALRFYALYSKLPYGYLRSGHLDQFQEVKLDKYIADLLKESGLGIVGGNFDFRVETLAASIDEYRPDIVIIDGIYLIKVPGKDRIEQAANAFSDVKRLTTNKKLPIVVTSQFNREVKKNNASTVQAESIALTDAAQWHSTLVFGLTQTDDNKKENRMLMKQLKVRDGSGEDFECNWNFDTMDFSEVPKAPGGGSSSTISDAADIGEALGIPSGGGTDSSVPF